MSRFGWGRLLRIAGLALALLVVLDLSLAGVERRITEDAAAGRLRNTEGRSSADACLMMLSALPPVRADEVVVMVGASVTFGSNIERGEALPAQLAALSRAAGSTRSVFNCAQPGGGNDTPLPVAAAFGGRPVSLLLIDLMVPLFAERGKREPAPPWSEEEISLLELANAAQRRLLEDAGRWPPFAERAEAGLAAALRAHWRLYRFRGPLWIDDRMVPDQLVWTLRREIATAGFLPRRFHGQTTNVGAKPWREAYVGGQKPSGAQRFVVPEVKIAEREYVALLRARELAALAGVPVVFYELPLNLPFQREFGLMDEAELARLAALRTELLARMRGDGLALVEAPVLGDDAFLDRAHLTPAGARALAAHLLPAIEPALAAARSAGGAR